MGKGFYADKKNPALAAAKYLLILRFFRGIAICANPLFLLGARRHLFAGKKGVMPPLHLEIERGLSLAFLWQMKTAASDSSYAAQSGVSNIVIQLQAGFLLQNVRLKIKRFAGRHRALLRISSPKENPPLFPIFHAAPRAEYALYLWEIRSGARNSRTLGNNPFMDIASFCHICRRKPFVLKHPEAFQK